MTVHLKSLSKAKKGLLGIGTLLLLIGIIGSGSQPPQKEQLTSDKQQSTAQVKGDATEKKADTPKQSVVETKYIEQTLALPYSSITQNDANMPKGQRSVTPGQNGEKTITFKITYTDGKETERVVDHETITKAPINEITKVGTMVAQDSEPECNPNYSGCVPEASDVDCADGQGNGPAFVRGPIKVIGSDVYGLDRDHDGIACE